MPKYIHSKLSVQEGLVMSELSERIGTAAGNAFKSGFNCGEAILQAFRTEGGLKIDDNTMRMVTAFGGGGARASCLRCAGWVGNGHQLFCWAHQPAGKAFAGSLPLQ